MAYHVSEFLSLVVTSAKVCKGGGLRIPLQFLDLISYLIVVSFAVHFTVFQFACCAI